jgi:SAM-dependent MidA family methyltransferase
VIVDIVRERGPLTVAAFMDLALYHPELGYYARAARRTGRTGDFFTSVDVGPVFGELLEIQIAEMISLLSAPSPSSAPAAPAAPAASAASSASSAPSASSTEFSLVEAGAGNGRLMADVLDAMRRRDPALLDQLRVTLVEASPTARTAQRETLRELLPGSFQSTTTLPEAFEGVLFANELLDAFPVHQVVMRPDGLREIYVAAAKRSSGSEGLEIREGPPSTPALAAYLHRLGVALKPGWRVEINLRAVEWVREAAATLRRGFIMLIDYGHPAAELYSASHASGTLATFARHVSHEPAAAASSPAWLQHPGQQDITAHVDFTTVRETAEAEGLTTLGFLDQTYFVLGLLPQLHVVEAEPAATSDHRLNPMNLQLKTLLLPGGLGSTMKVLLLAKGVGRPSLRACSYRVRAT